MPSTDAKYSVVRCLTDEAFLLDLLQGVPHRLNIGSHIAKCFVRPLDLRAGGMNCLAGFACLRLNVGKRIARAGE